MNSYWLCTSDSFTVNIKSFILKQCWGCEYLNESFNSCRKLFWYSTSLILWLAQNAVMEGEQEIFIHRSPGRSVAIHLVSRSGKFYCSLNTYTIQMLHRHLKILRWLKRIPLVWSNRKYKQLDIDLPVVLVLEQLCSSVFLQKGRLQPCYFNNNNK